MQEPDTILKWSQPSIIKVNATNAIVFRDDVVHSGGLYPNGNGPRLHCYLERKRLKSHRTSQIEWAQKLPEEVYESKLLDNIILSHLA